MAVPALPESTIRQQSPDTVAAESQNTELWLGPDKHQEWRDLHMTTAQRLSAAVQKGTSLHWQPAVMVVGPQDVHANTVQHLVQQQWQPAMAVHTNAVQRSSQQQW